MRQDKVLLCVLVLVAGCFSSTGDGPKQPGTGEEPPVVETAGPGGEGTTAAGPGGEATKPATGDGPAAGAPKDPPATNPAGTGFKIRGVVTYAGTPPERRLIQIKGNQIKDKGNADCAAVHGTESILDEDTIINGSGRVKNVFLYVKDVGKGEFPTPDEPVVLDQVGCMYQPRVQGIRVGQTLRIVNSDALAHNVRSYARRNRAFNIGQPGKGTREKTFRRPELAVRIACDFHSWMTAHVFVMDHPFFTVSDESGSFAINGLPAGKHTLVAWHEKLGKQETEIDVTGELTDVNFEFKASKE